MTNKTRVKAAQPPAQRTQRALASDELIAEVQEYTLSEHLIERCEERGIGILEVYSTLADPTFCHEQNQHSRRYQRGDLRVVVDPTEKRVITVVDLEEGYRKTPRVALVPEIVRGVSMATGSKRTNASQNLDEAWLFAAHTKPDMREIFITPELAEKLLARNTANRPETKGLTRQYIEEIENDNWQFTHEPGALDTNQVLQDGQHRLHAIVETKRGQKMFFAVGMDPTNFKVIGTGRTRRFADSLALQGFDDAHALGAMARLVYIYLNLGFTSTYKVLNHDVVDLVSGNEKEFMHANNLSRQMKTDFGLTRAGGGAAVYLIRRINPATPVNEFFEGLATGAGIGTDDPRLVLRRVVKNNRGSGPEHLAMVIKTWNAWLEGRLIKNVSWKRKGEAMPQITRFERTDG
jgi:hypothetical protein